ncbi:carboxymuconolactone decarboxylase family protein [Nocardia sp. NPDC057663]|uniref:carboxymuconolactone decarboxylase family protein n=1 Tax=Nocardia sp. NPDC057663 TaxID=3346201 RepID=UPI00366C0944
MDDNDNNQGADNSTELRRRRGIGVYSRIFEVPEHDVASVMSARVGPVFAAEAFVAAGGAAWTQPGLTGRDRSIAIITAPAAQGISGDRLTTHLRQAGAHGISHDGLTALMTLLATYIGYPRASSVMETIERAADSGFHHRDDG